MMHAAARSTGSGARSRRVGPGDGALVRAPGRRPCRCGTRANRRRSSAALREALPHATLRSGESNADALQGVQRVLKSPGLSPHDARIAPLLQAAHEQGVPVQGELELFVQALEQLRAERDYAPQVLAVTGTNGKTTTTALTALLVERAGRSAVAAGNISPTMLDTLMQRLDDDTLPQVWVLELSSFQLDGVLGFEPHAAAVLNLTQDHLDWHGDMAAYGAAKARIFGERTVAVVNRDDPLVDAMASAPLPVPPPKPAQGQASRAHRSRCARHACASVSTRPRIPATSACVTEGGMAWLVRAMPDEPGTRRKKDEPVEVASAAPDAGRCAARARPPQRGQRARRAGAGHRDRLPAGADAAWPARIRRRAAPRAAGVPRRRRRGVRRQQGHQRRRHGGCAGGARRRQGAGAPGGDPGRRWQGAGLRAIGRAGGAPCARGGADRARRGRDRRGARGHRRAEAASR